ncbi:very-short-patch-repair endonuclease [Salinibacterium sp. CAN_S4]|uniref:endonuclease domain-containing protein n=1 Tax=Salinibacterium sp. CAN_S4 TaxID=2787727 RepID=UPI0018F029A6
MGRPQQFPPSRARRPADVAAVIALLGGAATRQQLLAKDLSGYDLTRAVRLGEVFRVRQGRYILKSTTPDVSTAVRVGGMLAGPSAARSYGIWSGTDQRLHISVGDHASRLRTNIQPSMAPHGSLSSDRARRPIVLHWLIGGAVDELGAECWRVSLGACLTQMVEWSTEETALACLDTALQRRLIGREDMVSLFDGQPLRSRLTAARARFGADSGAESLVARRLRAVGILVDQQVSIRGVGRVDMRVRNSRVIVEVDGRTYHEDPIAFENDRRRDAELVARGYVVVRLSYIRVLGDWDWCQKMVLAAIAHHGHPLP